MGLVIPHSQARKQSDKAVNHPAISCPIPTAIGRTIVLHWVAPKTAQYGYQFPTQKQTQRESKPTSRHFDRGPAPCSCSCSLPWIRVEVPQQTACYQTESLHIGWSFSLRFHSDRRSKASTRGKSRIIPRVLIGSQNDRDCLWEAVLKMR